MCFPGVRSKFWRAFFKAESNCAIQQQLTIQHYMHLKHRKYTTFRAHKKNLKADSDAICVPQLDYISRFAAGFMFPDSRQTFFWGGKHIAIMDFTENQVVTDTTYA